MSAIGESRSSSNFAPMSQPNLKPKPKKTYTKPSDSSCFCDKWFFWGCGTGLLLTAGTVILIMASQNACLTYESSDSESSSSNLYASDSSSPSCAASTTIVGAALLAVGVFCCFSQCAAIYFSVRHSDKKRHYQKI